VIAGCHPAVRATVYAEDQPQYVKLPALIGRAQPHKATTRWRLTWRERWKLFWRGELFIQILTFGHPLQPLKPLVDEPSAEECV
jgi:hypothetical protein